MCKLIWLTPIFLEYIEKGVLEIKKKPLVLINTCNIREVEYYFESEFYLTKCSRKIIGKIHEFNNKPFFGSIVSLIHTEDGCASELFVLETPQEIIGLVNT